MLINWVRPTTGGFDGIVNFQKYDFATGKNRANFSTRTSTITDIISGLQTNSVVKR